jgi:hypothetical protein
MAAFEIPSATQRSFPLALCDRVCASLKNLAPVGVLHLLLSLLLPVKGSIFTGGYPPLEKLPSRQKVAESEIGKEDVPMAQSGDPVVDPLSKEDVHMAQSGGPVVGPPSKESPGPSVSTTSTEAPMVIPIGLGSSVVGPPSKESTGRFVKPSVSTTSTGAPMVI